MALQGTETDNFEFPLYTKDGSRVELLLNAATRRDGTGAIVGVVGVGQDITDRKNAETRVSLLAADLRLLVDSANAPIIGIDAHGCVNEWNHKAAEITGFSKEEVTGRYLVRDFIIDEYKVAVNAVLHDALDGKEVRFLISADERSRMCTLSGPCPVLCVVCCSLTTVFVLCVNHRPTTSSSPSSPRVVSVWRCCSTRRRAVMLQERQWAW
jgi:hypothetical protein